MTPSRLQLLTSLDAGDPPTLELRRVKPPFDFWHKVGEGHYLGLRFREGTWPADYSCFTIFGEIFCEGGELFGAKSENEGQVTHLYTGATTSLECWRGKTFMEKDRDIALARTAAPWFRQHIRWTAGGPPANAKYFSKAG